MMLTVEQVEDICDNLDLEYSSFTNTYSGRGMYGNMCIGWDLDHLSELASLGIALAEILGDAGHDIARSVRTDSMGRGYIAYFPDVTCPLWDESKWEDNEDDY